LAVKFATKDERDEFLRQQYEPATKLPAPTTPGTEDKK
jgi:hypothetical protein